MIRRLLTALAMGLAIFTPAFAQEPDALARREAEAKARGQVLSDLYQDLSADLYDADLKLTPALQGRVDAAVATEREVRTFALDLYEADGAVSGLDVSDPRTTAIAHYDTLLDTLVVLRTNDERAALKAAAFRRLAFVEAAPLPGSSDGSGALDCTLWDPLRGSEFIYALLFDEPADRAALQAIFTRLEARARRCAKSNGVLPASWRQLQVMLGRIHMREKRYAEAYAAGEAAYRAELVEWRAIGMFDDPKFEAGFRMKWLPVWLGQLIAADAIGDSAGADVVAARIVTYMQDAVADPNCSGEPACRLFSRDTGSTLDPAIALAGLATAQAMRPLERLQRAYEKTAPGAASRMKFELSLAKSLADQPDTSVATAFRKRGIETARTNMARDWPSFGAPLLDYETDDAMSFGGDAEAARAYYDALERAAPAGDKPAVLLLRAARMHRLMHDDEARADYEKALQTAKGKQRFDALSAYGDFLTYMQDFAGARAQYSAWLDEITPETDEDSMRGVFAWQLAQAMLATGDAEGARAVASLWAKRMENGATGRSDDPGHEHDSAINVLVRTVGRIDVFEPASESSDRRCARALWELEKATSADLDARIDETFAKAEGRPRKVLNAAERMRNADAYCPDPGSKFGHRMNVARAAAQIAQKDEAGARKSLEPLSALHLDDMTPLSISAGTAGLAALAKDLSALEAKLMDAFVNDRSLFDEGDRRCQRALLDTIAAELAAQSGDARQARTRLDAAVKLCDDDDIFASSWFGAIGTAIRIRLGEVDAAREEIGPAEDIDEITASFFEPIARQAGAKAFADELAAARQVWRQRQRDRS